MFIPKKFKINKSGCFLLNTKKLDTQPIHSQYIKTLLKNLDTSHIAELYDEAPFMNQLCLLNQKIPVAYIGNYPETYIFTEKLYLFTLEVYTILEENNVQIYHLENNIILLFFLENKLDATKIAFIEKKIEKSRILQNEDLKILSLKFITSDKTVLKNHILRKYIRNQIKNNMSKPLHPQEQAKIVDNYFKDHMSSKTERDKFEEYYKHTITNCDKLEQDLFSSKEFDRFQKHFDKKTKKFIYPLKDVFGPRRPYSYKLFKNMLDKFRNKYLKEKKEYEKNI